MASKTDFVNVWRAPGAPRQGLSGALVALRLIFEPSLEFVNARVRLAVFRVRGAPPRKPHFAQNHIFPMFFLYLFGKRGSEKGPPGTSFWLRTAPPGPPQGPKTMSKSVSHISPWAPFFLPKGLEKQKENNLF